MAEAGGQGVQPYIFYRGRCAEAIAFYQERLDADVLMMMRFSDAPEMPPSGEKPADMADRVMHACLYINGGNVMMSDGMQSGAPELESVSLSLSVPDEAAARRYFDALAKDGEVQMPLGPTFFSPCFGAVKDKFGLGWMVIVEPDEVVA